MLSFTLILFVGILLIGVGATIYIREKRKIGFLPIIVGTLLLLIRFVGPLSSTGDKLREIKKIESSQIQYITIRPSSFYVEKNITQTELRITDPSKIAAFAQALNTSKETSKVRMPIPDWTCIVEIEKNDGTIIFRVRHSKEDTKLSVDSEGDSGWHYGTLQCNSLAEVIESCVE